jgi:aspartate 1-decarboxylase
MRTMLKSKIHGARVTDADLHYEGSLTLDADLMEAAGILPYEQLHVFNINNGARLITYAIEGGRGSGVVCLNGAAARLGQKGDLLIVLTFASVPEEEAGSIAPRLIYLDENNRIVTGK